MANRELNIKITTQASLTQLTALANAFDSFENQLKRLDNASYLDGLTAGLGAFKAQVNEVTGEVKELAAALNQLSGRGGIKGFQQSLNAGINLNLKGAKVAITDIGTEAAKSANRIEEMNTATENQIRLERERSRIRTRNVKTQKQIQTEAAEAQMAARANKDISIIESKAAAEIKKTTAAEEEKRKTIAATNEEKRKTLELDAKLTTEENERIAASRQRERIAKAVAATEKKSQQDAQTSADKLSRFEERQQRLVEQGNIQLRRRQLALEKYDRALDEIRRTEGSARPDEMSRINKMLSEAEAELKQVNNALQSGQTAWASYGREVQEDFEKFNKLMNAAEATRNSLVQLQNAARVTGKDSKVEEFARQIETADREIGELHASYSRLQKLMYGGTMTRGPGVDAMGNYTTQSVAMQGLIYEMQNRDRLVSTGQGSVRDMAATSNAYKLSVQQVKQAEAEREAQFKQSIQTMRTFANNLRQLAGALSQFAAQLRSRANQALAGFGMGITGAVRTASSKFAALRASLDATGNSFIGFGRKANQGIKQSEIALNNFFSAGWSMLASGGIVSMFGQRIFDQLGIGLSNYMSQEQGMVRLGISGDVWGEVPQGQTTTLRDGTVVREGATPYSPGDIRPLQDLIFGLQSGRLGDGGNALTSFNAADLTDALYFFSSAIGSNLLTQGTATARALEPLLRVASVTETNPETLIKGTLNTMMEFGYDPRAMIKAGDTSMFDQMAGMIAIASNVSSMEVSDVFEAFKMMGPMISKLTGATEGAGLEDAMAAIFMASEVGLKGGNVGRGLDRLVSQLVDPDGPMQEVIKKYFGDTATVESLFFGDDGYLKGGLQGVFKTILDSGLSEIEMTKFMSEMFTQNASRAGTGIMDIEKLQGGADVEGSWAWFEAQMTPENVDRFLSTATAAMENTVSASFTNIGNAWNATTTNIVESIRGDLIGTFGQLADVIWNIAYAVRDNPALGRFVASIAGITASIALAVGGSMVLTGTILLVARAFHTLGGMIAPVMRLLVALPSLLAVMAPAFLLVAAAATALFVAWNNDIGGIQTRFRSWVDNLGMDDLVSILERVTTGVTRVARAFHELIGGVVLGVTNGPFNNLQALLQDLMGNALGNRAFTGLVENFARLREGIQEAREGTTSAVDEFNNLSFAGDGTATLFDRIIDGGRRATVILQNLAGASRGVAELFAFGATTRTGGEAIQAVGGALGIAQPLEIAAAAMQSLHAILGFIGDRVRWVVAEWQQFISSLSQTTTIGSVIGAVFRALGAAIIGFVIGITTAFARVATIGSTVVQVISGGFSGLSARLREAAAACDGFGKQFSSVLTFVARAVDAVSARFSAFKASFAAAGGSITSIAAAVGGAIGLALGVRLIAMVTPALGLFLRFGTMLGQVGVWVFQLAAQFAILGARIAVTIATALVQLGLFVAQQAISITMWAAETVAAGINAAAKAANAASTTALAGAQVAATATTGGLIAAILALDVAMLPLTAIIAAVVLVIAALPIAFVAAAAGIFLFVSATSGIVEGFRSLMSFLSGFWNVFKLLGYHVQAFIMVINILLAPLNAVQELFGITTSKAKLLGIAFGALAVVVGTAALGAFVALMAPMLGMASVIYVAVKAIEFLVDHWRWLYDNVASAVGWLADAVETGFGWVGEQVDWLIEKLDSLVAIFTKLASFAGLSFVINKDTGAIDVLKTAATAMIPGAGIMISGAQSAYNVAQHLGGAFSTANAGYGDADPELIRSLNLGAARDRAMNNMLNYTPNDPMFANLWTPQDLEFFNQRPELYPEYVTSSPDNSPRPFDPKGQLSGADRLLVREFSGAAEGIFNDNLLTGNFASRDEITKVIQTQFEQMYGVETTKARYMSRVAAGTGYNQFQYGQMVGMASLEMNPVTGEYGTNVIAPTRTPTPQPTRAQQMITKGKDIFEDIVGPENADAFYEMLQPFVDFGEDGAMSLREFNDAYYDAESSWMMKGMFPEYEQYQKDATEYGKWVSLRESFLERGWSLQAAEREWTDSYGTAPPVKPDLNDYISDEEALEVAGEASEAWKQFMETMLEGATTANLLAEDLTAGLKAVFGDTTAAGALGTFAEGIMGNIDEEVLKANPWFNQDELMANAAIFGGGEAARTETGGKQLRNVLRPMLEQTAAELGVTVDSLLEGLPQYYFDPALLATAQTTMFSTLEKLGPQTGAILDALGMTPDATTGRVFSEMGLDWAGLTQYAISTAMDGQDWDLSHYLMEAWGITNQEAQAYLTQMGIEAGVVGSKNFAAVEAAYLASNGDVAAATSDFWKWIAKETENGSDMMLDLTRESFEEIPEAWRILASQQGIKFNIIDPTDAEYGAQQVIKAIDRIRNAGEEVQRLFLMPGISNVNQTVFGANPSGSGQAFQVSGNSLFDLPGRTEFESMLNFNEMLRRGGDNDVATLGLKQIGEEVDGMITVVNELNGMQITIPAPEFEELKTGADEMRRILDEEYVKFLRNYRKEKGTTGISDGTGTESVPTFADFLQGGANGLIDENGEWIGPPMSEAAAMALVFGGNVDWEATIGKARENVTKLSNVMQNTFQNSMRSDTQIATAMDDVFLKPLEELANSPAVATAATTVVTKIREAIAQAFSGGGTVSDGSDGLVEGAVTGGSGGIGQTFIDAIATQLGTATIDLSVFGANFTTEATTWGTTAGAAFATAFKAAMNISNGIMPPASGGNSDANGSGFDENYVGGQGQAVGGAQTVTITVDMKQSENYFTTLETINTDITTLRTTGTPIIRAQLLRSIAYITNLAAINLELTTLAGRIVAPTVTINDNATPTLMLLQGVLNNLNRTYTATVNVVEQGSKTYPGLAKGGLTPSGSFLVGEEGVELLNVGAGSRVFDADATRTKLAGESMLSASPFTNSKGFVTQTTNNSFVANVSISNPVVNDRDDIDRLATEVSRRIGKEVDAMLNGQRPR